ncbi:MAG: RecX family transcriptional regulator [Firmicutes bacterium]|nr:RecX family transcriptional regulator [Bacillota bacterium]
MDILQDVLDSTSKITSLEVQKSNKERLNVYVNNEFFCGISLDDVIRYNIVVGRELTDSELSNLLASTGENDLYIKALGYILRSPRTEREITQYLYKKDASPETVARVIARLRTMNYINDEAYAKMFTEQKSGKLGVGSIRNKLFSRGINKELIEQSIEEIVEEESQEELCNRVAEKYMRNKGRDAKTVQKLYRHLASKGFDYELVSSVADEYKKQQELDIDKLDRYQTKWQELRKAKEEARTRKKELKQELKKLRDDILGTEGR